MTSRPIAGTANRHRLEVFQGVELAAHAHLHHVQRRLHRAGRLDRVLLAQLGQHLVHVKPELGQAFLGDFNKQLFVLCPKQLHFGHIRHAQQLLAHVIGKGFEFRVVEAVRLQRVDHAIHIPKIIIEEGTLHIGGQRAAHVADLFAHAVPEVGHVAAFGRIFDLKDDLRLARFGVAANLVGVRHFLQRALELVGHLLGHLLGGGARPVGAHYHGAKGERRVFILPQLKIGGQAQQQQNDHQITGERRMLQRPLGEVKTLFGLFLIHGRLTWRQQVLLLNQ
jgi:hypothetical protein